MVSKFAGLDLRPEKVSNLEMGYIYEELIRRFSELSNETAGEHFTPREVIRLNPAETISAVGDGSFVIRRTVYVCDYWICAITGTSALG